MTLVKDLLDRSERMISDRYQWERTWRQVCDLCLPFGPRFRAAGAYTGYDALAAGPASYDRGKYIYDSTPIWIVDRLTAGIESMATPAAQKWHTMKPAGVPLKAVPEDQALWCEDFRDYMFEARYNPKSGFILTNQKAIRNSIALGTAVFFVEEAFGQGGSSKAVPMTYMPVPLSEACIGVNYLDQPDTLYRRYCKTARNLAERFKGHVSPKTLALANDPVKQDQLVEVLHCVMPRDYSDQDSKSRLGTRGAVTASYYVEVDTQHMLGEGGYFEFPFVVYYWNQSEHSAYGESPMMYALADVKMLQLMNKHSIRAFGQWVDPPMALAANGVTVNMNARAMNSGLMNPDGSLRIKPIITQQRPDYAEAAIEKRREALKESMYLNLFQTLVDHPEMTATEAMIRNNEKGDMLGPIGAKIQAAHASMFDREFGILARKGAMDEGTSLAPPSSLSDKEVSIVFSSPFDRLRRSHELTGIQTTLEIVLPLAKGDPTVMDGINGDEILTTAQEITGAPRRILRTKEEIAQIRQQRQQQQMGDQALAQAETGSKALKNATPALVQSPDAVKGIKDVMGQLGLPVQQGAA